jgi:hypothetical protein
MIKFNQTAVSLVQTLPSLLLIASFAQSLLVYKLVVKNAYAVALQLL